MILAVNKPIVGRASAITGRPSDFVFRFVVDDFFESYPRGSPERTARSRSGQGGGKVLDYQPSRRAVFAGSGRAGGATGTGPSKCAYEVSDTQLSITSRRLVFSFELPEVELFMRPFEELIRLSVQEGAESTVRNIRELIEKE
jgi:hypothetical protein